MQTILTPTNLSRLSIGYTDANGQHTVRRFVNNGQGELILQPVEPDGDDSHPNEPLPPPPPTLELDNVIVWSPAAAAFFATHGPTPIAEVQPMSLSAAAIRLAHRYMNIVNKYENEFDSCGYTPRELELVRTRAHNELIEQLRAEGVDVSDRLSTTVLAEKIVAWLRD